MRSTGARPGFIRASVLLSFIKCWLHSHVYGEKFVMIKIFGCLGFNDRMLEKLKLSRVRISGEDFEYHCILFWWWLNYSNHTQSPSNGSFSTSKTNWVFGKWSNSAQNHSKKSSKSSLRLLLKYWNSPENFISKSRNICFWLWIISRSISSKRSDAEYFYHRKSGHCSGFWT